MSPPRRGLTLQLVIVVIVARIERSEMRGKRRTVRPILRAAGRSCARGTDDALLMRQLRRRLYTANHSRDASAPELCPRMIRKGGKSRATKRHGFCFRHAAGMERREALGRGSAPRSKCRHLSALRVRQPPSVSLPRRREMRRGARLPALHCGAGATIVLRQNERQSNERQSNVRKAIALCGAALAVAPGSSLETSVAEQGHVSYHKR
jgi:hypothetical protein